MKGKTWNLNILIKTLADHVRHRSPSWRCTSPFDTPLDTQSFGTHLTAFSSFLIQFSFHCEFVRIVQLPRLPVSFAAAPVSVLPTTSKRNYRPSGYRARNVGAVYHIAQIWLFRYFLSAQFHSSGVSAVSYENDSILHEANLGELA